MSSLNRDYHTTFAAEITEVREGTVFTQRHGATEVHDERFDGRPAKQAASTAESDRDANADREKRALASRSDCGRERRVATPSNRRLRVFVPPCEYRDLRNLRSLGYDESACAH